jgi:hypothetical protein
MNQSPNATKCVTIVASSSDEEEIVSTEKIKFKKGANRVYYPDHTFETFDEAHKFITNENIWTHEITTKPKAGKKFFYRCNQTLKRGKQCSAAILIFQPADTLKHEVHRTHCKSKVKITNIKYFLVFT